MSTGNGGRLPRGVALSELPAVVPQRSAARGTDPEVRLSPARRRREWSWVALGVGLALLLALIGYVGANQLTKSYTVLVTTRAVPAGHVFTIADVRPASVSASELDLVRETDEDAVVGHTAAVSLPAGAPVVRRDIGSAAPTTGTAIVAVLCKPGQFPPSLGPGDHVTVIGQPPQANAPAAGSTAAAALALGVVLAVDVPSDAAGSGTVVSLQVDSASAPLVAQAAVDGRISVIITAGN